MKTESKLFLFFILFSWFTIPPLYKIGDTVNLNWIYVTFLVSLLFLIFLSTINRKIISYPKYSVRLILFLSYLIISIFWSYSPVDSLRYINKLLLLIFLILTFSNLGIDDEIILQKITTAILFFLIVNWFSEITIKDFLWKYPAGEYFEGFSGRHAIKYYVAFSILFSSVCFLILKQRKYIFMLIILILTLIFIFQRGVMLATILGLITILYKLFKGKFRLKVAFITISLIILLLFFYLLFFTETGIQYTFYSLEQRNKFLTELSNNPIYAYQYINFKGRLEYWDLLILKSNQPFGLGFGSSGRIIEENFGAYNELHNDWLQFYVELGIIGVILYALFWISLISYLLKLLRIKLSNHQKIFVLTTLGYSVFVIVSGIFDHVIDYYSTAVCLGILVSMVSNYRNLLK